MRTLNLLMALVIVALLVQACGSNASEEVKQNSGLQAKTKIVKLSTVPKVFHYTGSVASVNQSTLSTRLMGQIKQVLVDEGDAVQKGQLLISIRSNDIQAKYKQVEANIIQAKAANKHAKADFDRIQSLYESKSATQKELDDITVHYEMVKAQLEAAAKAKDEVAEMLTYADIRAPYAGVITQKFMNSGDMANPGMPLLAIEAPGLFEVEAKIPESEIYKVEKGDRVEVFIDACKEPIKGSISRVSPSSRFSGTQFDARIALLPDAKQNEAMRSGVFAHVNHLKGEEQKLLVDQSLIVERGQLKGIWTLSQSNEALLRWVRLGKTYGDKIEVLSGLNNGSVIITSANGRLFDGAALQLN